LHRLQAQPKLDKHHQKVISPVSPYQVYLQKRERKLSFFIGNLSFFAKNNDPWLLYILLPNTLFPVVRKQFACASQPYLNLIKNA
jgi:hypothetical protein